MVHHPNEECAPAMNDLSDYLIARGEAHMSQAIYVGHLLYVLQVATDSHSFFFLPTIIILLTAPFMLREQPILAGHRLLWK
jgi:hypothetical protein